MSCVARRLNIATGSDDFDEPSLKKQYVERHRSERTAAWYSVKLTEKGIAAIAITRIITAG